MPDDTEPVGGAGGFGALILCGALLVGCAGRGEEASAAAEVRVAPPVHAQRVVPIQGELRETQALAEGLRSSSSASTRRIRLCSVG